MQAVFGAAACEMCVMFCVLRLAVFMNNHLRNHRTTDLAVLVTALAASAIVAMSLGQDNSWDQKNYHYYAGYALLNKPLNYDFAPAQVQSFFNPLIHVPTYLMLRYLPGRATALILGAIQGLNFWLIYKISKKLFSRLRPGQHCRAGNNFWRQPDQHPASHCRADSR
jgi:hypothetical protein